MKALSLQKARPTFPALFVGVVLLALWAFARFSHALHSPALDPAAFIGWLSTMYLLATMVVILWTATVDNRPRAGAASRTFLAYALVSDLSGALLFLIGVLGGLISLWELLKLYLLLIAWLGLWTSVTGALRRFGMILSATTSLLLGLLFFAAPLAADPLLHASSHWSDAGQARLARTLAHATPVAAAVDALQDSFHLTWPQLPAPFHPFGNDLSIPLPRWWISAAIYAGLGLLLWLLRRPWRGIEP